MLQQRLQLQCRVLTSRHVPRATQRRRLACIVAAAAAAEGDAAAPAPAPRQRAFTCVRLRGLPFDVTEEQVAALLGFELVDFFCINRQGRFSGEAFAVLSSEQQVEAALSKDRSNMGKRYVEVFRGRKAEYYRAIAAELQSDKQYGLGEKANRAPASIPSSSSSSSSMGGDSSSSSSSSSMMGGDSSNSSSEVDAAGVKVLLLRGLPFRAEKEDIMQWFEGVAALAVDDVRIITDRARGRPDGTALVRFASPQDAQKAAAAKHKQYMGSRYIEVNPCSRDEVQRYMPRSY
ncbi:hypothetical protein COO60DRAFT_232041 [Scenedesmus sp. NREL 46B-D3]|nr:hypothetical protein COO60DRAFT_232041 [Scenedesmus sp. NREL 46B-D3]